MHMEMQSFGRGRASSLLWNLGPFDALGVVWHPLVAAVALGACLCVADTRIKG